MSVATILILLNNIFFETQNSICPPKQSKFKVRQLNNLDQIIVMESDQI